MTACSATSSPTPVQSLSWIRFHSARTTSDGSNGSMRSILQPAHRVRADASELVPGLAERALAERKHLGGAHRHGQGLAGAVVQAAVPRLVLPSPIPLRSPRLGETLERLVVGDLNGFAFDHDVEPVIPFVAAGRQYHIGVVAQVNGLLLAGARAEV